MTFNKIEKLFKKKFGGTKLSDIAKEFGVTPQVVSNWKSRNQVPYKYVRILRKKINKMDSGNVTVNAGSLPFSTNIASSDNIENEFSIEKLLQYLEEIITIIKKYIRLIVLVPLFFSIVSFIHVRYFVDPIYVSVTKILPSSGKSNSSASYSGLASSFGIDLGQQRSPGLSSSEMYPEIIKSRRLAKALLFEKFDTKEFGPNQELIRILLKPDNIPNKWDSRSIKKAISRLIKKINVVKVKRSQLLRVSIKTNEADFSKNLLDSVIKKLDELVTYFELSKIKEKKDFIKTRIDEVHLELTKREDAVKVFREKNRSIISSPALMLSLERLIRESEVQKQIYITLKSQFEMAQIEEVERSSKIQILDFPEAPTSRLSPNPKVNVIIGFVFGLIILITFIFSKELYIRNKNLFPF